MRDARLRVDGPDLEWRFCEKKWSFPTSTLHPTSQHLTRLTELRNRIFRRFRDEGLNLRFFAKRARALIDAELSAGNLAQLLAPEFRAQIAASRSDTARQQKWSVRSGMEFIVSARTLPHTTRWSAPVGGDCEWKREARTGVAAATMAAVRPQSCWRMTSEPSTTEVRPPVETDWPVHSQVS